MKTNSVTLSVVIQGNENKSFPAREFVSPQDRQTYVEGRDGSIFTLRIQNGTASRILAIPSVDGLSVLDGKPAGTQSSGYVVDAHQTLEVPGWVVDNATAAKFIFAGLKSDGGDDSYVALSGGDTAHKGVIGLKVFEEKRVHRAQFRSFNAVGGQSVGSSRGLTKGMAARGLESFGGSMSIGSFADQERGITSNAMSSVTLSASSAHENTSSATQSMDDDLGSMTQSMDDTPAQSLGTGFGDATKFDTQKVEFKRGDLIAMMELFYDDRRGLKKRGINVDQPEVKRASAFPADNAGCAPPANWKR